VRKADNLQPSCAVVMKYGNLNVLEPSGPLRELSNIFGLRAYELLCLFVDCDLTRNWFVC